MAYCILLVQMRSSFTTYLKFFFKSLMAQHHVPLKIQQRCGVLLGKTYEKMVLPVLSPDPNTDATCPTWIMDPSWFFVFGSWEEIGKFIILGYDTKMATLHPGRLYIKHPSHIHKCLVQIMFLSKWVICRFHVNLTWCFHFNVRS